MAGTTDAHTTEVKELEQRLDRVREIQHEIRNIVMGLTGQVELLHQHEDLPDRTRDRVEQIRAESTRLRAELEDLDRYL